MFSDNIYDTVLASKNSSVLVPLLFAPFYRDLLLFMPS